ncbi:non-structural maintenance of chromosomes element, partial [Trifolium medium]|nr:non-structural maintenance of chromosomes element [Trifolium medium]
MMPAALVTSSQSQGSEQQSQESQQHVPYAFKNFNLSQKDKTLRELAKDLWLDMTAD